MPSSNAAQNEVSAPHKRRAHYSGTHLRSYKKNKELNPEKQRDTIERAIRKGGTTEGMTYLGFYRAEK